MSWSNYLVFEKEKVAFELTKAASYYVDGYIEEDARSLSNIVELVCCDETIEQEVRKLTLKNVLHILKVYFETITLDEEIFQKMFIYWFMQSGNTNYVIMHEDEFAKIVTPEYRIFELKWDEDSSE